MDEKSDKDKPEVYERTIILTVRIRISVFTGFDFAPLSPHSL
jgi:hypothetical protein